MSVWWVNQNKYYDVEQEAGIIFGRSNETPEDSHKNRRLVSQVQKGDIIIHYVRQHISAVSQALRDANTDPSVHDAHGSRGWHCDVQYHEFERGKQVHLYKSGLNERIKDLQIEGGPIHGDVRQDGHPNKRAGYVREGYLFPFSAEGLDLVQDVSQSHWPQWALEKGAQTQDVARKKALREELALREQLWEDLISQGGPNEVSSGVVRDVGLYKGQAGIWADKSRTADLTPNGQGITVSVLHTGNAYDDDLDEDGLLYYYPDTNRPGRHDANEVEATKNAARFGLPIFVITYPDPNASTRNVKRGWVEDWDDQARTFLIRFSDKDSTESAPGTQLQMHLGSEGEGQGDRCQGQEGEEPFQLTDSSPSGEMTERPTRPGQSQFKFYVVKRYGPCCVVCDVDIEAMLDACHLREKKDRGSDHSGNGLVLCANHHRAFDSGLFAIEPGTLTVHMQDGLDREDIGLTRPSIDHLERPPHPEALQWRWTKWTEEE